MTTSSPEWAYRALADIYELPDSYRIVADMPGADPNGLELTIEEGVLRIDAAVSRANGPSSREDWIHHEYGVGSFHRRFAIEETVDADAISADYQNGTLLVTLPKKQSSARRQVPIKVK
ncbi:MAG: Hsp20/alpha crystallin family protein [Phycisphaerales bacterium]